MEFSFPFTPYPIQEKFMNELYHVIENGKLGIFESPTGTGKSLSICCSSLKWMKDNYKKQEQLLSMEINSLKSEILADNRNGDWLEAEYEKIKKNHALALLVTKLDKIKKKDEYYENMKLNVSRQKSKSNNDRDLIKYSSKVSKDINKENIPEENLPIEDDDLVLEDDKSDDSDNDNEEEESDFDTKIYISSRTHSQLSQFVGEIKRTIFNNETRVVTLASRQHFCINPDVVKLKNVNLINERCLDLQKGTKTTSIGEEGKALKKSKTKSCSSCPYYNQTNIKKLNERLLVDIMDMEDLVKAGKDLKACPYYASRMALSDAEVVLVSHAGIVSAGARSGVSLKLENSVLILDEAHGLTAALENAHSTPVSLKQLSSVKAYLQFYIDKYRARLSSRNLLSLNQISFIINKLYGMINKKTDNSKTEETFILTLEDFVIKSEIDNMNIRPLVEFARNSRIAPKLHGFSMRYSRESLEEKTEVKKNSFQEFLKKLKKKEQESVQDVAEKPEVTQTPLETSAGSGLYAILDFLERLCDRSENGRILVQKGDQNAMLKYLLLNPAEHLTEVVNKCRSVVVAGGTMEPISEFKSLLTGNNMELNNKVHVVKCDHVVPADNVLASCLSKGPSNVALNFSYDNRQSKQLIDEVGRIIRNVCNIVPGGVICFLPSYSYEQTVYEHLKGQGTLDIVCKKKQIFREPKSAADVEQILNKYAAAVKSKQKGNTGALLFSVVGGKLSEGLNFSDDLGRCVLVIGMPYPNMKSPELQEKMNYLNRTIGNGSGSIYYENLCMKAVNQCIGRAVRHVNDYASIVLVDERYSRTQTISALPSFVQKSLMSNCNFGPTIGRIAKFFAKRKEK